MWITIAFQTGTAYIVALIINQVGSLLLGSGNVVGAIVSILIAVGAVGLAVASGRDIKSNKEGRRIGA